MRITEAQIDDLLVNVDANEDLIPNLLKTYSESQPNLIAYILSDNFSLLTASEKEYLEYLSLVMIKVVDDAEGLPEKTKPQILERFEERAWEMLNENEKAPFRDKLTPFFDAIDEEDLLAYIEDSLEPDEDDFPSLAGRDLLFSGLVTLMQAILRPQSIEELS